MIIKLTKNQEMIIDDDDFEKISKYKWHASEIRNSNKFYAMTQIFRNGKRTRDVAHRIILGFPNGFIDHINGNPLDNRKRNLRICTNSENLCNRPAQKSNKIGYKNIWYDKERSRFCVDISFNRKKVFRGRFAFLDEAILARNVNLIKYHGEFAFIDKD
jgi:hypothetical protein